jgi:hypothetical protein
MPRFRPPTFGRIAPLVVVLTGSLLSICGLISLRAQLLIDGAVIAFVAGMAYEAAAASEQARRALVASLEGFLAWGHGLTDHEDLSDDGRQRLERDLDHAQAALRWADGCAPVTAKLRRRIERRRHRV